MGRCVQDRRDGREFWGKHVQKHGGTEDLEPQPLTPPSLLPPSASFWILLARVWARYLPWQVGWFYGAHQ